MLGVGRSAPKCWQADPWLKLRSQSPLAEGSTLQVQLRRSGAGEPQTPLAQCPTPHTSRGAGWSPKTQDFYVIFLSKTRQPTFSLHTVCIVCPSSTTFANRLLCLTLTCSWAGWASALPGPVFHAESNHAKKPSCLCCKNRYFLSKSTFTYIH